MTAAELWRQLAPSAFNYEVLIYVNGDKLPIVWAQFDADGTLVLVPNGQEDLAASELPAR